MRDRRQASGVSDQPDTHIPVLLREVMRALALQPGNTAIDCTFGGGGYSRAMLDVITPDGRVLALDRDPQAIARVRGSAWVRAAGDRLTLVHADFRDITDVAAAQGVISPRGIVADLGLSSLQLADSDRGFSFQRGGLLDMRFDPTSAAPMAADILRTQTRTELERTFRRCGEEPAAGQIARAIVEERRRKPITTTAALVALIERVVRRRGRIHPATRIFQALRIAVNDELATLDRAIPNMFGLLPAGGRLAIVSFHSLEDRIVKQRFRQFSNQHAATLITRHPIRPSAEEIIRNPRSRSAKLRVIEHL